MGPHIFVVLPAAQMYKFIKKHVRSSQGKDKGDKGGKASTPEAVTPAAAKEEKKKAPAPRPLVTQPSLQRIVADGGREEVARQIEDVYNFEKELGKGAFSVVKLGVNKQTKEEVAIKIIEKKNVEQDLHRLATEMQVLKSVDHPNIIKLKDIFETDSMLYIVTEVVTGGELFDRIVDKGSYCERDTAVLIRKLVSALEYLHSKNIVHRDLKPENLLLKSLEEDTEIKLADFGLSKVLGQEVMMQTACGTPGYVAPEILQTSQSGYGKEVDMWSVGVITYILLCGFPPFYNDNVAQLFESIINADFDYPAEYWDHISDDAIDFIDCLLIADPSKRLTANSALEHSWLKGNAPATPLKGVPQGIQKYQAVAKEQSVANMAA